MRVIACLLLLFAFLPAAQAATISGSVVVMKKGGGEKLESFEDAVVYLEGITESPPASPAESWQRNKTFVPRLLPVVKGQEVRFYNGDPLQHNVFSNEEKKSFDLGSFPKGEFRAERFEHLGVQKIYCNIHQSMVQDIVVLPSTLFATTDTKGNFTIKDVPAGNYTLKVWHIHGGSHEQPMTAGKETQVLDPITITSTQITRDIVNHRDKFGRRYKSAY